MKKMARKMSILLAAAMAAGSLTACSGMSSSVAATYGSKEISMKEATFWLRYEQWMTESVYWDIYTYLGYDNMWEGDSGDGVKTMADSLHENVMAQMLQTNILMDHAAEYGIELTEAQAAKVTETVTAFLEENPGFTKHSDATQDEMEEYMTNNAIAVLVAEAVREAAEVSVSDEESQVYTVEYIQVTESTEEETEAEGEEAAEDKLTGEALANQVLEKAQAGDDMSAIASELELTSNTESYLLTGETSTAVPYTASVEMKTGDVQMVEGGEGVWYIVKKVSDLDEEATEAKRAEVEESKRTAAFNEVYTGWAESAAKFTVNESAWSKVVVSEKIYEAPETEATETEAAETEATEAE